MLRHIVGAAVAATLALFASTVSAKDRSPCALCTRTVPLVTPMPLLPPQDPKSPVYDYRPAINATATTIVFEREIFDTQTNKYLVPNLYMGNLATGSVMALAPTILGSARADWCWRPTQPRVDGPIAFSKGNNGPVYIMPPRVGATPHVVPSTNGSIYPTWYPNCALLAIDTLGGVAGPTTSGPGTQEISVPAGTFRKNVTGTTLWAGFPSVNSEKPNLVAFAGQQFTLNNPQASCNNSDTSDSSDTSNTSGYYQNCNYVYIANTQGTPPRIYPLDRYAPVNMYNPDYEGRAPTWSPDGKWIAFESNRACIKTSVPNASLFFQIYIQDAGGLAPARPVTDCKYNAQHAKWYRNPVRGHNLLVVSVLAYPGIQGGLPGQPGARQISSLDVTAFVAK